jgi:hypothetical protein
VGISAVLTQVQKGENGPISFASRQLNTTEKKLSATEKELLAVIFGTKQFRCDLYGRKFTLVTDHRALCWLLELQESSPMVTEAIKVSVLFGTPARQAAFSTGCFVTPYCLCNEGVTLGTIYSEN